MSQKIVWQYNINIRHKFKGQIPAGKKLEAVYQVNCSCSSICKGETRRVFEISIKDHKAITRQEEMEESARRSSHNIIQYCGSIPVCASNNTALLIKETLHIHPSD